jgi:hypothetical protein
LINDCSVVRFIPKRAAAPSERASRGLKDRSLRLDVADRVSVEHDTNGRR